jgi:uncharacterized protein YndB with AHSA1/START domain
MSRWIRRALFALVSVLLAGAGLLWWLGKRLPVEHVASSQADFQQPPETVWRTLTDLEQLQEWREDIHSVEILEAVNGLPRWREENKFGRFDFEVIEMRAPEHLLLRLHDPEERFGGTWTYALAPLAEGKATRLTVTEAGSVHPALMRAISHYLMGPYGTMDATLSQLGAHFGQQVEPIHLPAEAADR